MSESAMEAALLPHRLCSNCKTFWSKVTHISHHVPDETGGNQPDLSWPEHIIHSQKGSEVKVSASKGCHFCSILLGSITGCTGTHGDQHDFEQPIYISISVLDQSASKFILTLFPCEQERILTHDQMLNKFQLQVSPLTGKGRLPEIDHTASPSIWHPSTFSPITSDFIRSWLEDCRTNHFLCGTDLVQLLRGYDHRKPDARPRRMLDLQAFEDPNLIRLIELENDVNLEYCCLSYSWGFSQPYKMKSTNIIEFMQQIRVPDLPNLMRDTIEVVRRVGFRYLWIDALCIMQDGKTSPLASIDWYDQVYKLNDIFDNSVLTIAASESFDGDGSLIQPRNPLSYTSCRLVNANLPYEVIPYCTPRSDIHNFDNARYHLDTRAWVFQERILSPRTVHMTNNFIHLECRTELRCEASGASQCHHSGAVAKADYQNLFALAGLNGLEPTASNAFLSCWHDIIRRYSKTKLARPSNFLIAVSGLIKRVEQKLELTSSFGMWREHLLHEMLWYVRGSSISETERAEYGRGRTISHPERAPSWAWASVEVQGAQIVWDPTMQPVFVAELIDVPNATDSSQHNPLSAAHVSYPVKIRGQVKHGIEWSLHGSSSLDPDERVHVNCQGSAQNQPQCPFHPDYELSGNEQYCSLLMARVSGFKRQRDSMQTWETEVGIVLAPLQGGRYRRVGYFHHNVQRNIDGELEYFEPSLFEDCEVKEVVIV